MRIWQKKCRPEPRRGVSNRSESGERLQIVSSLNASAEAGGAGSRERFRSNVAQSGLAIYAESGDRELVDGLRAGSVRALERIMVTYRSQIYSHAFRFSRNHHDAEEVVQETFLRAYRGGSKFRGDCSLAAWLHTIAKNLACNRYWQRQKQKETLSLDAPWHLGSHLTLSDRLILDDRTARNDSEEKDLAGQIEKARRRLPERDRRILQLRIEGRAAYAEIARVLGIAIGTVKSQLARARERLRVAVGKEHGSGHALVRKGP